MRVERLHVDNGFVLRRHEFGKMRMDQRRLPLMHVHVEQGSIKSSDDQRSNGAAGNRLSQERILMRNGCEVKSAGGAVRQAHARWRAASITRSASAIARSLNNAKRKRDSAQPQ